MAAFDTPLGRPDGTRDVIADRLRRLWTDPTRRRWLAFGALAATYGLVSIHRLSTAVLADRLTAAFAVTGTELGTLHASFFVVYAVMQLPAGVFADRLGSRRTVAVGTVVMSLGGFVFAGAQGYVVAFLGRALVGFGGSVLFVAILRFCANWFRPTEFARMSGFTLAVSGLGGVLATTPLALAVAAAGWRATVAGLAVFGLALAALAYAVARDDPAAAGFDPIGGVENEAPGAPTLRAVLSNARVVVGEAETWLCGVILFAGTGVNITVLGLWGIPYLVQTYGLSVTAASTFTLLGSAGLLVGPPVIGAASDRLGDRTGLIAVGMGLYAASLGVLAATGDPPLAVVAAVLFATGGLAGSYALVYAVVKERHDADASGVSTGTVNTMAFVGAAIMPTLMGYVLDAYWTGETIGGARVYTEFGYRVAFGLAAAAGVAAFVAAVWLHRRTDDAIA